MAATPPAFPGGSPGPDAETVGTATIGAVRPEEAEVVSAPPPAVIVDDSPPEQAVGAGGRARSAEIAEGGRPEKKARVEASRRPLVGRSCLLLWLRGGLPSRRFWGGSYRHHILAPYEGQFSPPYLMMSRLGPESKVTYHL